MSCFLSQKLALLWKVTGFFQHLENALVYVFLHIKYYWKQVNIINYVTIWPFDGTGQHDLSRYTTFWLTLMPKNEIRPFEESDDENGQF